MATFARDMGWPPQWDSEAMCRISSNLAYLNPRQAFCPESKCVNGENLTRFTIFYGFVARLWRKFDGQSIVEVF
jgi:hypothetical protein